MKHEIINKSVCFNTKTGIWIKTYETKYSRMDQVKFVEDRSILDYFVSYMVLNDDTY